MRETESDDAWGVAVVLQVVLGEPRGPLAAACGLREKMPGVAWCVHVDVGRAWGWRHQHQH